MKDRLVSLDALRGFDMLFIMGFASLVAVLCRIFPNEITLAIGASMDHVEWNGLNHHDTIFPLFLFLAGVSFPFSLAKQREKGMTSAQIHKKIIRRGLTLVLLGIIYNGLFDLRFDTLRCASVLGRIGLAWMFGALLFIHFSRRFRLGLSAFILIVYGVISKYVAAPDVPGADPLSMEGCLVGYIDRLFLPGYLYVDNRFDPEGLLSVVPAIVTAMLGMFTGELLKRPESEISGNKKTIYMLMASMGCTVLATVFHPILPINKMLWSSTFVCAVGAYSFFMMALFYYLIDVKKWRRGCFFFQVIGMNSITIYLAQRIVNFTDIAHFFTGGLQHYCDKQWGYVILLIGYIAVCWLFLYFLYRKNTFLKV